MDRRADPVYVLEQGKGEEERLIAQSGLFAPATHRLLVAAGIGPGMRILDVGCGVGDVALLCADLVGPTGAVVGIDREEGVVARARERVAALGHANVTFTVGDYRELPPGPPFDAVIGRLVLMYAADPAAAIRSLLPYLHPGGIVAFQEMYSDFHLAVPAAPTYTRIVGWWQEVCARAGIERAMGPKLYAALREAGLATPQVLVEAVAGGGEGFGGYAYMAAVARSLRPIMARLGLAPPDEAELEGLEDRFRREVVAGGGCVTLQLLYGGWARIPPAA